MICGKMLRKNRQYQYSPMLKMSLTMAMYPSNSPPPFHYTPSSSSEIEDWGSSGSNSHVKNPHIGPGGADQDVDNVMGNPTQDRYLVHHSRAAILRPRLQTTATSWSIALALLLDANALQPAVRDVLDRHALVFRLDCDNCNGGDFFRGSDGGSSGSS